MIRNDILEKKMEILSMIDNHQPKSEICRFLKCKPETLEGYLKKMNITYKGNMGMKGKKIDPKRLSALQYSKTNVPSIPKLRRKLIEDGIKKEVCEKCGVTDWLGEKIKLELHHIDGNRYNNNFSNLQILCPNCHSLTPNHSKKK